MFVFVFDCNFWRETSTCAFLLFCTHCTSFFLCCLLFAMAHCCLADRHPAPTQTSWFANPTSCACSVGRELESHQSGWALLGKPAAAELPVVAVARFAFAQQSSCFVREPDFPASFHLFTSKGMSKVMRLKQPCACILITTSGDLIPRTHELAAKLTGCQ